MKRHLVLPRSVAALAALLLAAPARAAVAPLDFVVENAVPGVGFNNPTALAFTPDGRILVAEKRGVVRLVKDGVKLLQPMWSGEAEVLNNGDRGLLSIAVDPHYATNHYVYLAYAVDPDSNGVDDNDDAFGRVTRYRTSEADSNVIDPASRTVLIGATWSEGFPSGSSSHAVGALRWGADGSLLVSWGEGAHYTEMDQGGIDPGLFGPGRIDPNQDIGAFRAQYVGSLGGKVLRINPETGRGYTSNPFYDGDLASNRSRIWAYGFRNPFRFCVEPGTGSPDTAAANPGVVCIGDVGWNTWEELDVAARGGLNFGWPCYEGGGPQPSYQEAAPAHNGCGNIGTADNPSAPTPPAIAWHHADSTLSIPAGIKGNCVISGAFYTGAVYPAPYRNRLFFADFGRKWIKVAALDGDHRVSNISDFIAGADGPVDFEVDPISGDVHFLAIYTATLYRIRYTGPVQGNSVPVAAASGGPTLGFAPLDLSFSSTGSLDRDNDALTLVWNFGDGTGSTEANPRHTYETPGDYDAVLTVTDGHGGLARDTVRVIVGAPTHFPATATLDDFHRADGPLGPRWTGVTSRLAIERDELKQITSPAWALWDAAVFGPDQEAHVVFGATTPGAEHDLLLKVQGTSWQNGTVQVHYDSSLGGVVVLTYAPATGWLRAGGPFPAEFGPGDRLGARVYGNGAVEVYRGAWMIGSTSIESWPFAASGGRIGLMLVGASSARLDSFGGGDIVLDSNTPPHAVIDSPPSRSFYAAGDSLRLGGGGFDGQDAPGLLQYRWEVDLHHNNHIHPCELVADGPNAVLVAENHDDGTGVWMRARFIVTDTGGKSDTTWSDLFPSIDLIPTLVLTDPSTPTTDAPTTYKFTISNQGPMPAPISHWRLVAGARTLAEGDTLVPARGSVEVSAVVPPVLAAGSYDLRVVVDTLATVVETNETNDARTRTLTVKSGTPVSTVTMPQVIALSSAYPNPSPGEVRLALELPRQARVGFSVYDLEGREVWSQSVRSYPPGRWKLRWSGETVGQGPTPSGIYLARVSVDDRVFTRRLGVVR